MRRIMQIKISVLLVSMCFLLSSNVMAQSSDDEAQPPQEQEADSTSLKAKADKFNKKMERLIQLFPVPIASYAEETGVLYGLTKFNDFNIGDTNATDTFKTQPSTVTALIYYTQKKQFKFNIETDLMFHHNKQNLKARMTYLNFPLLFYGVGDHTKKEDAANVLYENVEIVGSFSQQIIKNGFVGASYKYLNSLKVEYTDTNSTSPLIDSVDVSKNAGVTSGFGFVFLYEGRDNRLNPFKGAYFNMEVEFFRKFLGSNFQYTRLFIDTRKYVSLIKGDKLILAGQVLGEFVTDGANIQGLPALGGPDWGSRGVYFGRFRDNASLAGNLEFRFPLFWIFGGTVFGGVGQVQSNLAQFKWDQNHYVYGAGFRVMVSSKNRVNLRFDLGFSKDDSAFIVEFSEAF